MALRTASFWFHSDMSWSFFSLSEITVSYNSFNCFCEMALSGPPIAFTVFKSTSEFSWSTKTFSVYSILDISAWCNFFCSSLICLSLSLTWSEVSFYFC